MSEGIYDVLLLHPDTHLGQSIIRKINDINRNISIYVPSQLYGNQFFHENQIIISKNSNDCVKIVNRFRIVVSCCDSSFSRQIEEAIPKTNTEFYLADVSDTEAIIKGVVSKLPVQTQPSQLLIDSSSINGLNDIINVARGPCLSFPVKYKDRYIINLDKTDKTSTAVLFKSILNAVLYWFISLILHTLIIFNRNEYNRFTKCKCSIIAKPVSEQKLNYKINAYVENTCNIKADVTILNILRCLKIKQNYNIFDDIDVTIDVF